MASTESQDQNDPVRGSISSGATTPLKLRGTL